MVVIGSLALGLRIAMNMRGRITALRQVERILCYIEGELTSRHARLGEALSNVSVKTSKPYSCWLSRLAQVLDNSTDCDGITAEAYDFYTLWCRSLIELRDNTQLSFGDITSLYDVGKALGYLDIESQQMNLRLERERLHAFILDLDKDLNSRMKNAVVMCFLGGLLTVIALV